MTEEMVTDEIETEVNSPDARSTEEFFFGNAESAEVAGVAGEQDTVEETHGEADTPDDAGDPEEPDDEHEQGGPAGSESSEDLKVILSIRAGRSIIGVQQPSADPHIEAFDGLDLPGLALQVPAVVERARARWEDEPMHPAHERPAPPARRRGRRQQEVAPAATDEGEADQQQPETLRLF